MKAVRSYVAVAALWAGLAAATVAQAQQLVVGQVAPLSGTEATQGRAYSFGMRLYLDRVNKAGGVHGQSFALVRKNDQGLPDETLLHTRQLLAESRPLVLAGFFGNRNLAELQKSGLLEQEKIALVGFRSSDVGADSPWVYGIRAGLKEELQKVAVHLSTVGIKRLALLHEDGAGAAGVLAATEEALQRAGAKLVSRATYPEGSTKVTEAVDRFVADKPQAILMVTSGAAAAAFVEDYRSAGGAAQLFAHSGTDIEQLSKRLSETHMQGLAISQVTPNPYKITTLLTREFNEAYAAHPEPEGPLSYAMLEGYIAAKVIVEAVRRAGPRASRESFVKALAALDAVDLGGYPVGFRGGSRTGARFVELSIVSSSGRIRQ